LAPVTPLADEVLGRVRRAYTANADPQRAQSMAAYMRDQFPYFGIAEPARRKLDRDALRGLPGPAHDDLVAVASGAWEFDEREMQYAAIDYVGRHARHADPAFLVTPLETLLTTKSWWDTTDGWRAAAVGPLVATHAELTAVLDRWIDSGNEWLVRSAVIHQLAYGPSTDVERLFGYCTRAASDPRFFVRKGIGWALRQYSKVDAAAVRGFVATHLELSALSRREALAWLDRQ
jgi:3-methyladenine DNA glycosylase AlkD